MSMYRTMLCPVTQKVLLVNISTLMMFGVSKLTYEMDAAPGISCADLFLQNFGTVNRRTRCGDPCDENLWQEKMSERLNDNFSSKAYFDAVRFQGIFNASPM